jgi:superfamily II DNA or RNA helicase
MEIIVTNNIELQNAPHPFRKAVKERLTIENPKFRDAVRMNRWAGNLKKDLQFYQDAPSGGMIIPRGFALQLIRMATKAEVSWRIIDQRRILPEVDFSFLGILRDYQQEGVEDVLRHDHGVLDAATGSGKTIMALDIIAERKQSTLIIVHTKELLEQWIERASQFLNLDPGEIGIIGNGKKTIGDRLTIGIVNSIYPIASEIREHFGQIIIDECHRCPSRTFSEAVSAFDCRFMLGLSATPYRRDGLSKLIYWYLGDVVHSVDKARLIQEGAILEPEVITRRTDWNTWTSLTARYATGISELTRDQGRNRMIVSDVIEYLKDNPGPVLVLSDRRSHCETLQGLLFDQGVKAEVLTGDLSTTKRREVVAAIRSGVVPAICATGSLIGEGFDLPDLSALFLTTPVKFAGRVTQYIGRILRPAQGKDRAVIYDYCDTREPVLANSARARAKVYAGATV